jgi:RND family efflux transporter MFP subunit
MQGNVWLAIVLWTGVSMLVVHAQEDPARMSPVPVSVRTVEQHGVAGGVRYSAEIKPSKQVDLAFKVGGYVQMLLQVRGADGQQRDVQEGDRVTRGTVLARVRDTDYLVKVQQAQAQLAEAQASHTQAKAQLAEAHASHEQAKSLRAEAQASHEQARLDFERATNLLATQSVTKSDYDAAKSRFEVTQAKVDGAQAQLALAQATVEKVRAQLQVLQARIAGARAQLDEANIAVQDSALKSPIDAVVLKRPIEVGTLVTPGTVGFVLADTTSMKAVFGVPDVLAPRLQLGSTLVVSTEALPGVQFRGQLSRISPAADPKSRVFEVELTIPNPHDQLRIGNIGALEIVEERGAAPVAVVPLAAVVRSKDDPTGYAVFVVQEQEGKPIARVRKVKIGTAFGNMIAVLEGVKPGERVIITGSTLVLDGAQVQIIP